MNSYNFHFLFVAIVCLFIFSFSETQAQSNKLPPFRIMQPNGKVFKAEYLPFEKPIVIIYFSPDCDDCVKFMDSLFKRIDDFNGASLVLITYLSIGDLKKFTNKYKIDNFKNIYTGTEGSTNFIRNYYKMEEIPFAALYDKNGNIISSYSKDIPLNNMIVSLKKLHHQIK